MYLTKSSNVFASYYLEEINKSTKTKALLCSWFIVFNDGILKIIEDDNDLLI